MAENIGLHNFMAQLIDYAGLFPPAKLPLNEAFANYSNYRNTADQWMLARFIIPARRLDELAKIAAATLSTAQTPFSFSILGRSGNNTIEFLENLKLDLAAMQTFQSQFGNKVQLEIFETRLPPISQEALANIVTQISEQFPNVCCFFEANITDNWQNGVTQLAETVAALPKNLTGSRQGCKLRCGGVTADLFPTPEEVAFALHTILKYELPFKATAGLHHPFRHYNATVATKMHGFFNLFGAALLGALYNFDEAQLLEMIKDENPDHFQIDAAGFQWQDYRADPEQIASMRQRFVSYGSCSFDEPREDLTALGLL